MKRGKIVLPRCTFNFFPLSSESTGVEVLSEVVTPCKTTPNERFLNSHVQDPSGDVYRVSKEKIQQRHRMERSRFATRFTDIDNNACKPFLCRLTPINRWTFETRSTLRRLYNPLSCVFRSRVSIARVPLSIYVSVPWAFANTFFHTNS